MEGAGGLSSDRAKKRKFKHTAPSPEVVHEGADIEEAAGNIEAAAAGASAGADLDVPDADANANAGDIGIGVRASPPSKPAKATKVSAETTSLPAKAKGSKGVRAR